MSVATRAPLTAAILTTLAVLAAVVPAAAAPGDCREIREATETEPAVSVCRQDVWFHANEAKLGNLAGQGLDEAPSWDTTKPTASVASGAGGGYLTNATGDILEPYNPTHRPTFSGTFTGNLDNVAVTAYMFSTAAPTPGAYPMLMRLDVDGTTVFDEYNNEIVVQATAGGQAVTKIQFAFTDIFQRMEDEGMQLEGEHDITVSFLNYYIVDGTTLFVYDTSEAPSGMVFNLEPSDATWNAYTKVSANA